MGLAGASLGRPVTVLTVFVCLLVVGIICSQMLPLEFLPEMNVPFLGVEIPYPGSTPEEVERRITQPVEEALATISGIKSMRSDSNEGGAYLDIHFDWGVDANVKALEAREKIDGIRHLLPTDLERYYVRRWSPNDSPVLYVRISSNRDLSSAYEMLDRNLKRRVERIPGVSKVDLYGVEQKEIRIRLSAERIIAHRIDIGRLVQTLQRSNFLVTGGSITDGERRLVVRPVGELAGIEDIGRMIIAPNGIRLRDVADITYEHPRLEYGRHLDRRYAVGLDVYKEAGANTVEVTRRARAEIDKTGDLPEMAGISIFYMEDMGEAILGSLHELLRSGLYGGLLAICVLFLFLRRFSTTFIVALSVPFSLLITMAFMYFAGISLNIISMMGLMLAVGMLVDNAVVVSESIHRHQLIDPLEAGKPASARSVLTGVSEVGLAITAGTLTSVIVFLPNILSPSNQIAVYLKHVAISMAIALGSSLVLAQTVVPLLISRVKPPRRDRPNVMIDRLVSRYRRTLAWSLRHRGATVGLMLVLLASVAVPFSLVKRDMFDDPEDRKLRLHYHVNGAYTLDKVLDGVNKYEEYLFAHKEEFEIQSIYTFYQGNYAMSTLLLEKGKKAKKSMEEIREAIRKDLPKLPIANPSFEWQDLGGEGQSVRIELKGKSSEALVALARDVAWTLSRVEGLVDVRSEAEIGSEEVQVVVDRPRAGKYGFSAEDVANVVAAAMRGINLRSFQGETGEIPVKLEFQESDKQTLDNLANLPLFSGEREPVSLASLAELRVRPGPRTIHREDRATSLGVSANLKGITMGEAKQRIGQVLGKFNFPAGYTWNYGQRFDDEREAFNTMMINLVLALALIYFVMAALFESLLFPAAIWTQIVFAVVGVFWFFLATGTTMTMMAMIGILILTGVVVNNGIVLVDYIHQLRMKGMTREEALLEGGAARMRPILMTAGTTVLSLVPLCVTTTQIGGGGPPYFPMARAIVGGLVFSTLVTLLILPTIYLMLDDVGAWARRVVALGTRRARPAGDLAGDLAGCGDCSAPPDVV
ncbi:MAG: efflux RND transporter permease subunit [bacterium]